MLEQPTQIIYPLWAVLFFAVVSICAWKNENQYYRTLFILVIISGFITAFLLNSYISGLLNSPLELRSGAMPFASYVHYAVTYDDNQTRDIEQIILVDNHGNEYVLDSHAVHPNIHTIGERDNIRNEFKSNTSNREELAAYFLSNANTHRTKILNDEYTFTDEISNEFRRHNDIRWSKTYLRNSTEFTKMRYYRVEIPYGPVGHPSNYEELVDMPIYPDAQDEAEYVNRTLIYEYSG